MKKISFALLVLLGACSSVSDKYEPSKYYNDEERMQLLSGIVNYIFVAPPYTAMKDRFKPEHKEFYDFHSKKFSLDRLYVDENKHHYYLVIRPGTTPKNKRAAGGTFVLSPDKKIENFREAFVTPLLTDSAARGKGRFLFDHMVKGDLEQFLKMGSYVQWPNVASTYDTILYQWETDLTLDRDMNAVDTIRINP